MNYKHALIIVFISLKLNLAMGASFGVSPIKLDFLKNQHIQTITVNNTDKQPLVVHLKTMTWSQKDGKDDYQETTDIIAVPNVVTIQPESSQEIRIAYLSKPDSKDEKSYRVFVHELPVKKASEPKEKKHINFIMCMGVPIYIEPLTPLNKHAQVKLLWDKNILKLKNDGRRHILLHKLQHRPHEKQVREILQVVLPHQSITVDLPKAATINGSKIVFHIDDEVIELNVPLKS